MTDLFGPEPQYIGGEKKSGYEGPYQKFRRVFRYRISDTEQKCENCAKISRHQGRSGKAYYKCSDQGNSASSASDVRLRNVCDRWKA